MSDLEKEKPQGIEAEQAASIESPTTTRPRPEDFNFTPEEQKKIKRRMDLRIVTTLGFMYCVSLMDRTNLGAASIAGMDRELRLDVGDRYVSGFPVFTLGCSG